MMRYERKVALLSGVLALLLAIWGAGELFSPERLAARAESKRLIAGQPGDVAALDIGIEPGKLSLVKEDDSWLLVEGGAKLPAQASRVGSFLDAVSAVRRLRPVGKSKDAWKGLDLEEGKAKPVLVRDAKGRALADFAVGGYGPTGAEVFVRLAGSEASYAVDTGIASYVASDRRSWLDLRVVPGPLPESDVEAVAVRASIALDGAGKPPLVVDYALRRDKEGWSGVAGADPVAVSALVRSALNLEGEDIVAAPPASAFSPVSARVELSLGNGGSKVLEVGAPAGEGRFYLRLAGNPQVYAVSAYGLRNILRRPAELVARK